MNRYKLIAFEPISENEISHYSFDGVENQEKPLNPNEEFIQLTNKIDFKKLNGKTLDYTIPDFPYMDEESESIETTQLNITENLKKSITSTLNEVNALIDILVVAQNGTYMNLEPITKENHEDNLISYLAAKKMGLAASATTLLNGTVRLSKTLSSVKDQNHQTSFYSDLAQLRKEWRIKWFQKHLVGDLSLSTVGSVFPENGFFQIVEEEDDAEAAKFKPESEFQNLKVILMNNQEGEPILRMSTNADLSNLDNDWNSIHHLPPASECRLQIDKLNRAQNLLFLQEIFSTLCWESRMIMSPVVIQENRLVINLKRVKNLAIDFLVLPESHWFRYSENTTEEVLAARAKNAKLLCGQHNLFGNAMVLLMRDLLREKHRVSLNARASLTSPVAGPVQVPAGDRYRGPHFYRPIDSPEQGRHCVFLLPALLDAVAFYYARADVLDIIDRIASRVAGSMFLRCTMQSGQSMFNCTFHVTIGCHTYTSLQHHLFVLLHVSRASIHLDIVSDRIKHHLVYESIDVDVLTAFFHSQIWNFKIDAVRKLGCVKHRWQLVDLRMASGGHKAACLDKLRSNHYDNNTNSDGGGGADDVGDDNSAGAGTGCGGEWPPREQVGIILLSSNGQWLLRVTDKPGCAADRYELAVSQSRLEERVSTAPDWQPIALPLLQKKLMKSDLETIDVLFTALY